MQDFDGVAVEDGNDGAGKVRTQQERGGKKKRPVVKMIAIRLMLSFLALRLLSTVRILLHTQ